MDSIIVYATNRLLTSEIIMNTLPRISTATSSGGAQHDKRNRYCSLYHFHTTNSSISFANTAPLSTTSSSDFRVQMSLIIKT